MSVQYTGREEKGETRLVSRRVRRMEGHSYAVDSDPK